MPPDFIPGLELCESFYKEAVRPILVREFPDLRYSAALLGYGSDVLGYDTPRSTDHEWGPRLRLFLRERDREKNADRIKRMLAEELPTKFGGYPTHFAGPDAEGLYAMEEKDSNPVSHRVEVHTTRGFLGAWLGFDPRDGMGVTDWLTTPQQRLLEVTAGAAYDDWLGELWPLRDELAWYPYDVWLYLLWAGWRRIWQEDHFVGRAGEVGDELGSSLAAARLVRDLMRLCFLMEKRYAPYPKWFGTAFSRLSCAPGFAPIFQRVLRSRSPPASPAPSA